MIIRIAFDRDELSYTLLALDMQIEHFKKWHKDGGGCREIAKWQLPRGKLLRQRLEDIHTKAFGRRNTCETWGGRGGWIACEDALPADSCQMHVWGPEMCFDNGVYCMEAKETIPFLARYYEETGTWVWHCDRTPSTIRRVTHWMPVTKPNPPKECLEEDPND